MNFNFLLTLTLNDLVKKLKNVKMKVDFSLSSRTVATQYSPLPKWLDSLLELQC